MQPFSHNKHIAVRADGLLVFISHASVWRTVNYMISHALISKVIAAAAGNAHTRESSRREIECMELIVLT
jgi:hypothetical protein